MKKYISRIMIILLALCMMSSVVSCGSNTRNTTASADADSGMIKIYYLTQLKTSLYPHEERLSGENTREQISNVLHLLSTPPKDADYTNSIPSNIMVRSFRLKDGTLTISFSRSYRNLSKVNEALLRASVVKTLVQVPGVDSVAFRVLRDALVDSQGNAIGAMNATSFVDDFDFEQDSTKSLDLTVYCPASDGSGLIKEVRSVYVNENVPVAQAVIKQLQKTPSSADAEATLPSSVKLLSISVNDGICYVDIDQPLDNIDSKVSAKLRIYSIVNSLCELDQISRVQIIVGTGDSASVITDDDKNGTYSADPDLVISK